MCLTAALSTETLQALTEWNIFKALKGKIYNQDYCTQQGFSSKLMEKSNIFLQGKCKRIPYHETTFTVHVKGNYVVKKYKKKKKRKKKKFTKSIPNN